jgi:lipid A 3-O-deacylase
MRFRIIQPRLTMLPERLRILCAAALLFLTPGLIATASAQSLKDAPGDALKDGPGYSFIDEARFGVLAANLEGGSHGGDYTINGELLFPHLGHGSYGDPIRDYFFNPRVHVGASISPGGVNQLYAGLTWDHHLTDRIFFETSFGGAIHDGETSGNDPDGYGCAVNFRESASVGVELDEHWRVMATVDHMSNAGLCDGNQGLTNAGVRLGYRW